MSAFIRDFRGPFCIWQFLNGGTRFRPAAEGDFESAIALKFGHSESGNSLYILMNEPNVWLPPVGRP
jgi:hypothetical protein